MRTIVNNCLASEADVRETERADCIRHGGRISITQRALAQFLAATAEVERLGAMLRGALLGGADVEPGPLDGGLWIESSKRPDWRQAAIDAGVDPAAVLAATPKVESAPRLRVAPVEERQRGRRVVPLANGGPIEVGKTVDGAEAEAA